MRGGAGPRAIAILAALLLMRGEAHAQDSVTVRADSILYGDNTEFRNPFREGETLLGGVLRLAAVVGFGDRAELTLGAFGHQRFGSDSSFELVRPVISLRVGGPNHAFVFGTLPPATPGVPPGPDRTGPHRLVPPLQRETLVFDRPYEAGLLWTSKTSRLRHEAWIDWQRVNTPEHRERFDAGMNGAVTLGAGVSLPYQFLIVHEGGQRFNAGPVSDSLAAAAGVSIAGRVGRLDKATMEIFGLASRDTPDRERARTRDGSGFFARASAEASAWRGHLLFWRGKLFLAREGDPNYQSIRRSGSIYGRIRDYAEAGLTRTFKPDPRVRLEASARIHRVERHYEYSYRILAVAQAEWRFLSK